MTRTLRLALLLAIPAAAAMLYFRLPWPLLLLGVAGLCVVSAMALRSDAAKVAMANLAALCVALAAFEGYLEYKASTGDGTRMEGTIVNDFVERDDLLGYRPKMGSRVTARKLHADTVIYDVVYSINADGLRVMPTSGPHPARHCAVFFGDSITFGEGVGDEDAYPYQVVAGSGGAVAGFNFAFSGYGPHQMLGAVQAGAVERIATCRPSHFVHLAILEHIARVAGLAAWDRHGPRFMLDARGRPVRDGNFDAPADPRWPKVPGWLADSADRYRTWQKFFGRGRALRAADLDLYLAVVRETASLLRERHPGSRFDVLLWDGRDDDRLAVIERSLNSAGINVHRLTAIMDDFNSAAARYLLGPPDGHPNALMHRHIADYVLASVVPRPGP